METRMKVTSSLHPEISPQHMDLVRGLRGMKRVVDTLHCKEVTLTKNSMRTRICRNLLLQVTSDHRAVKINKVGFTDLFNLLHLIITWL